MTEEEKIEILKAIDYYSNNKGSNKILIKIKNEIFESLKDKERYFKKLRDCSKSS